VAAAGGPVHQITDCANIHPESQIAWSPSGEEIAFTTIRGGYARVRVARVDNGRMRQFDSTSASTVTGHLAWAPGSSIAYQISSNNNIHLIDPASGLERALTNDPKSIAMHSPQYSPDVKHIAAFWFRGPGTVGIYSIDTRNSTSRRTGPGLYPRGWSGDGRYIYYQWPQSPIIYRIESDKPKQTPVIVLRPPFREAQCVPLGASASNAFVCAAFDFASDIWRIDNFDRRR
jgi:Tol biopolymer transport system component